MQVSRRGWVVATIVALFGLALIASRVSARPERYIYPHEMYQEASLIVIAIPLKTRDLYEEVIPDGTFDQTTPVVTDFEVEAIVQGSLPPTDDNSPRIISIQHNRYIDKKAGTGVIDGPSFIEFDPSLKNRYFIALKRVNDHYIPLSGWSDPGDSFFRLKGYEISDERKPVPPPG